MLDEYRLNWPFDFGEASPETEHCDSFAFPDVNNHTQEVAFASPAWNRNADQHQVCDIMADGVGNVDLAIQDPSSGFLLQPQGGHSAWTPRPLSSSKKRPVGQDAELVESERKKKKKLNQQKFKTFLACDRPTIQAILCNEERFTGNAVLPCELTLTGRWRVPDGMEGLVQGAKIPESGRQVYNVRISDVILSGKLVGVKAADSQFEDPRNAASAADKIRNRFNSFKKRTDNESFHADSKTCAYEDPYSL